MTALALLLPVAGLVTALLGDFALTLDTVLLSVRVVLDESSRLVLAVVAFIWIGAVFRQAAAGWIARRYQLCFLLTQFGSLAAIVVDDPVAYYAGFSIMTLASYGLVDVGPRARWAAALYLGSTLVGEMLLLGGLMMTGGEPDGLAPGLILIGLGAKLGMLPFHVALAPAYAVAPAAGAAVLGGVLTTVAAVGWLRFLPAEGSENLVGPAVVLGLAAAFAGAVLGLFQRDAKALLAYSTVSQMGLLTLGVGLALAGGWQQTAAPLLLLFILHHALAKTALLLGLDEAGVALGRPLWLALALLSLSLAGFPGTGGTVAKGGVESLADDGGALTALLPLTSVATAALMTRFLMLAWPERGRARMVIGWPSLAGAAAALLLPWGLAAPELVAAAWSPGKIAAHVWPAVAGVALAVVHRKFLPRPSLPAGDIAVWLWRRLRRRRWLRRAAPVPRKRRWTIPLPPPEPIERLFRSSAVITLLFAGTSGGLLLMIAAASR